MTSNIIIDAIPNWAITLDDEFVAVNSSDTDTYISIPANTQTTIGTTTLDSQYPYLSICLQVTTEAPGGGQLFVISGYKVIGKGGASLTFCDYFQVTNNLVYLGDFWVSRDSTGLMTIKIECNHTMTVTNCIIYVYGATNVDING